MRDILSTASLCISITHTLFSYIHTLTQVHTAILTTVWDSDYGHLHSAACISFSTLTVLWECVWVCVHAYSKCMHTVLYWCEREPVSPDTNLSMSMFPFMYVHKFTTCVLSVHSGCVCVCLLEQCVCVCVCLQSQSNWLWCFIPFEAVYAAWLKFDETSASKWTQLGIWRDALRKIYQVCVCVCACVCEYECVRVCVYCLCCQNLLLLSPHIIQLVCLSEWNESTSVKCSHGWTWCVCAHAME